MIELHDWRICGLLLGLLVAGGCDSSPKPPRDSAKPSAAKRTQKLDAVENWDLLPPKSVTAANVIEPNNPGAIFLHYCSVCHGPEGRGDGQYYSDDLPARPANLTDRDKMELLSDDHLVSVVTGGSAAVGKSPLCPPWGRVFSKEQIADLVGYIRQLPSKAADAPQEVAEGQ